MNEQSSFTFSLCSNVFFSLVSCRSCSQTEPFYRFRHLKKLHVSVAAETGSRYLCNSMGSDLSQPTSTSCCKNNTIPSFVPVLRVFKSNHTGEHTRSDGKFLQSQGGSSYLDQTMFLYSLICLSNCVGILFY